MNSAYAPLTAEELARVAIYGEGAVSRRLTPEAAEALTTGRAKMGVNGQLVQADSVAKVVGDNLTATITYDASGRPHTTYSNTDPAKGKVWMNAYRMPVYRQTKILNHTPTDADRLASLHVGGAK